MYWSRWRCGNRGSGCQGNPESGYCSIKGIAVVWYMVFAAVVLAFMVAYAAMFGFDKLKEALGQIHK